MGELFASRVNTELGGVRVFVAAFTPLVGVLSGGFVNDNLVSIVSGRVVRLPNREDVPIDSPS